MSSPSDQPTTVLRTPAGLIQWSVAASDGWSAVEVERSVSEALAKRRDPGLAALQDAYGRLASVSTLDADVARDVLLVLGGTVADPRVESPSLPSLDAEPPPAPYQPTAANPRAYRGTKDRPPKPKRPEPVDLRLFLMSAAGVERLARKLAPVAPDFVAPNEAWPAPASVRIACGTWLGEGWSEAELGALATLWHQLDGDRIAGLRARLGSCAKLGSVPSTLALLSGVLAAPAAYRAAVLSGLGVEAASVALDEEIAEAVSELCGLGFAATDDGKEQVARWMRALSLRWPREYPNVFAGARLSHLTGDPISQDKSCRLMPDASITDRLMALVADLGTVRFRAFELWEYAGWVAGVRRLINRISEAWNGADDDGKRLTPEVTGSLLDMVVDAARESDREDCLADIESALPGVVDSLRSVEPGRQSDAFWTFYEIYDVRPAGLPRAAAAIRRWYRTPSKGGVELYNVIEPLSMVSDENWRRLIEAPDDSMLAFEEASSSHGRSYLLSIGLFGVLRENESWAVDQFVQRPAAFARIIRLLALLSMPERQRLIREVLEEFGAELPAELSLDDVLARFAALPLPSGAVPIPRALRQHAAGEAQLKPGQLERHRQKLVDAWPDAILQALRVRAMQRVGQSLLDTDEPLTPAEIEEMPDALQHALLFQSRIKENRPALRRLVRAALDGDVGYLETHPVNTHWTSRLAGEKGPATKQAWSALPPFHGTIEGHGNVTLEPELRPLEALRMGTYVGSCYALGGSFSYSAAAIVLDANKQVIFARSSAGVFLARQVVAISMDWTLCCYEVYSRHDADAFAGIFERYNHSLSEALGIPLATEDDEVENLVSHYDWDDGVWIPDGDPAPRKRKP